MSTIEITSKIEALKDLEALIEEAKAEAETLRDEIKTEMLNRNTEEMAQYAGIPSSASGNVIEIIPCRKSCSHFHNVSSCNHNI